MSKDASKEVKITEERKATMGTPDPIGYVSPTAQGEQEKETYLPTVHGRPTDEIAKMDNRRIEKNPLNDTASITSNEVKLVISQFNQLSGTLGVSTHKLLSMALSVFTSQNHEGDKPELRTAKVFIPLKEYASMCGYDVTEHETSTPEEAAKEAQRAKRELDNARRKINKDLDLLYNASLSWKEKVKGKTSDYLDIRIISGKGIRNGYIYMEFSQVMGEYLVQLTLSQYPVALLRVDERNSNAYNMGLQMTEHYNNENNLIKGTAQLLKVSTLLSYTKLPSINDPSVKKNSWESRIKEPFENALDVLTSSGVLEDWYYSHSKGEELTDEEARFTDYETWADTLVCFTLKDAPDHTLRLEAKEAEKKTKAQKKKASKKKASKAPAASDPPEEANA